MRTILPYSENPALRGVAREIPHSEIAGAKIQTLIAEMRALLRKEEYGVALAAPQVGEPIRLFVISGNAVRRRRARHPEEEGASEPIEDMVCINPKLLKLSRGKKGKHEGCLSIRGKWGVVPRAEKATLAYFDENGQKITRGASGLLAHIFQHEIDHLEGILYTDKAVELYDDGEAMNSE